MICMPAFIKSLYQISWFYSVRCFRVIEHSTTYSHRTKYICMYAHNNNKGNYDNDRALVPNLWISHMNSFGPFSSSMAYILCWFRKSPKLFLLHQYIFSMLTLVSRRSSNWIFVQAVSKRVWLSRVIFGLCHICNLPNSQKWHLLFHCK